jgi:hypothetical protein
MKYILLIMMFITSFLYAQEYPKYSKDDNGKDIVIITIEQAIEIDNNLELLELLKKAKLEIKDYDSICVKVIFDKDRVISSQDMEIKKLKESLTNKDDKISLLHNEIKLYLDKIMKMDEQLLVQNESLSIKDKEIKKLKAKSIGFGVGGAVAIIGLVISIIFGAK